MPILEFMVTEPPTSAELEVQALASLATEDITLKALMNLGVRSKQQIPTPQNANLIMRIRRQEYDADGSTSRILGQGNLNPDTIDSTWSESVVITLSPDRSLPAQAHIVV